MNIVFRIPKFKLHYHTIVRGNSHQISLFYSNLQFEIMNQQLWKKGEAAAYKEMHQLHSRQLFQPIDFNKLTPQERIKSHGKINIFG
mmetsp:Transcript_4044/g.6157  ORF Transcript_4044/g.6157 Transcript_4044/m.6157 type:complete len:87 (+) Transcript_4044:117-377(+)